MDFEVVADGLAFPEGPVVMPDGSVILVECGSGNLTRVWGDNRKEVICHVGESPAGAQLGPDGAMYICNVGRIDFERAVHIDGADHRGRVERVDLAKGTAEHLYTHCGDRMLASPDDLVFDRQGNFWFTDIGKMLGDRHRFGGLYYATPDGKSITEIVWPGLSFNGVGLSPDEAFLYVADTLSGRIWQLRILAPGKVATAQFGQPGTLLASLPTGGECDSMAITASGKICQATLKPGGLATIDTNGAVRFDALPDGWVTNVAFGGADMCDAYVTLATTGRLIRIRWPEPGLKLNFGQY
jgi:gluconolactonase